MPKERVPAFQFSQKLVESFWRKVFVDSEHKCWKHWRRRLTEEQVREIQELRPSLSYREIAANYGVSLATAFRAANGHTWEDRNRG